MTHIRLRGVRATYQLLSVHDYNLKRQLARALSRQSDSVTVIHALNGVNLDVPEGSRLGLVGANGAGKSTMLSVMAGLLPPTEGTVEVSGRVLALLGGASAGLAQEATGRDNIIAMGVQMGETPAAMRARTDDITDFSGLGGRIDHPVHSYSSGMQTRLRFSILTSLRPDILLIDEGLSMADAEFTERASQRLDEFVSAAGILVLASHGDALLHQQCSTAVWLNQGDVMSTGDLAPVLADYHRSHHADSPPPTPQTSVAPPEPDLPERDDEATVAITYWDVLGRRADPIGLALHRERLRIGVSVEQLKRDLYDTLEARAARAAWPRGLHLGVHHDIPFTVDPEPDARHLLVLPPGIGTSRYIPTPDDPPAGPSTVHRLALGIDTARPWHPDQLATWADDAAALVQRSARALGVSLANVICMGSGLKGSFALLIGLKAGAGHFAVGAPLISIGSGLDKLRLATTSDVSDRVLFEAIHERSGMAASSNARDQLDRLIPQAAAAATHPAQIHLVSAPSDLNWDDNREFCERLATHPSVQCSAIETDDASPDQVNSAYLASMQSVVAAITTAQ